MPSISTTALEKRIREDAPHESKARIKAAAKRIAWRMMHAAEIDYYAELRILGITADPTAVEAIKNLEPAS